MRYRSITDRGVVRNQNQDYVFADYDESSDRGLFVVCDGMGGARAGNVASELACTVFTGEVKRLAAVGITAPEMIEVMKSALRTANAAVFDLSRAEPDCAGMGTTLVAALTVGGKAVIMNVGDSRAYLIGSSGISQITRDHSLVGDMVMRGEITLEESRTHPRKNLITRAVGTHSDVKGDIYELNLAEGEFVLLCSDGLSNVMTDDEIEARVKACDGAVGAVEALLALALERGAPDNVSVVIFGR